MKYFKGANFSQKLKFRNFANFGEDWFLLKSLVNC